VGLGDGLYEGFGDGFAVFDGFAVNVGLAVGAADDGDDVVAVAVTAVRGAAVSAVVSPANSTNVRTASMFLPAAARGSVTTPCRGPVVVFLVSVKTR